MLCKFYSDPSIFCLWFFVDVIGKISSVSDVMPVQSMYQNTPSNTRTIILMDLE
jgi:hypothetical protein